MSRRGSAAAAAAVAEEAAQPEGRNRRKSAAAAEAKIAIAAAKPTKEELALARRNERLPPNPKKAAGSKRKKSPDREELSESSEDEAEEDGEETVTRPAAAKKAKVTAAAAAGAKSPAVGDAPESGAPGEEITCQVCTATYVPKPGVFICHVCNFLFKLPMSAVPNQLLEGERRLKIASNNGSSVASSSQSDTTKPKLGAYETELRAILERAGGSTVPRFELQGGITHADAISSMQRNVYRGLSYQAQSQYLTDLIRSGHFKELTMALPITLDEAARRRTAESRGKSLRVTNGEIVATSESMVERPLTNLQEFLKIVVVSVLPTLFDRPRAMLDWLELSRSIINIAESADGWPIAASYLQNLLADRMHRQEAFNVIDLAILQTERASHGAAPRAGGQAGRAGGDGDRPKPDWLKHTTDRACREWNVGSGCKAAPGHCRYEHVCLWEGCGQAHQGRDCDRRPAGFTPRAPGAGGGGRQAQRGKFGGRPAAAAPVRK